MQDFEFLTQISEVSIAIAGFGGIAAGLGYRAHGTWHSDDLFRLILMVVLSLLIVFACYVPYMLLAVGVPEPWRTSAILVFLTSLGHLVVQYRRFRQGLPPGYNLFVTLTLFGTNVVVFGLATILVLGLTNSDQRSGIYLSTVIILLISPAIAICFPPFDSVIFVLIIIRKCDLLNSVKRLFYSTCVRKHPS